MATNKTSLKKTISTVLGKRTGMFVFFLIIASIVWFISRMSREYRANLQVTVYIYSSTNPHMPSMRSEEVVPVVARTSGFNIVRQRLLKSPVVYVDIKSHPLSKTKTNRAYMLTHALQNDMTQSLGDEMKVEYYTKDTVYFTGTNVEDIPTPTTIYGNGKPEPIY
jgi:hypothetical protein